MQLGAVRGFKQFGYLGTCEAPGQSQSPAPFPRIPAGLEQLYRERSSF